MAGISLTGMASGLDTTTIISQLMALEQNKVTAVQMRQVKVQAHKDDLSSIKTKLDAFKTAATALQRRRDVEGDADDQLVRHHQARRDAAQRRRHRRPHGPDRQARLVGPARLHLHAQRHRRLVRPLLRADRGRSDAGEASRSTSPPNATAADVATLINANESAPVYAAVVKDATNNERIVLSARKTGEDSNFARRHDRDGRRQLDRRGRHLLAHRHHAERVVQARRRGRRA